MSRVILHCDMNNFFASVECLLNPALSEKSVAVCGSVEDRHGIVLAKNDKAKAAGVKTGDTVWEARTKCKELCVVLPQYEKYVHFSKLARRIYSRYTNLIEPFGMDECWLDVTGSIRLFGSGVKIADEIRGVIKEELGLTVSVGVSFNKVFAKLGSDMKKPDATTEIREDNFKQLIYGLPASDMIGIGPATSGNLRRIGVCTIGELAQLPYETVRIRLGRHGENIWLCARGMDCSVVTHEDYSAPVKSIGRGITAVRDLVNENEVHCVMLSLSTEVARKLRRSGLLATAVQIAIRDCNLITREFQCPLPFESANAGILERRAFELFCSKFDWASTVRSVTVRAIQLVPAENPRQLGFDFNAEKLQRQERIDSVTDEITRRFGKGAIKPLSLVRDLHIPQSRPDDAAMPAFGV